MGLARRRPDRSLLDGDDLTQASATLDRRDAGLGYIPEDRHRDGMVLPFPLWENVLLGHQAQRAVRRRGFWIDRRRRRERDRRRSSSEFDVRTPRHRRAGVHAVGRQPAEADRRPRDDDRPEGADRRPTRPAASTSAPRRSIWDILRDARAAGLAVLLDLGRPRGADRPVRPAARDAAAAGSSPTLDPATVTPGRARLVHDRGRSTGMNRVWHRQRIGASSASARRRCSPAAVAIVVSSIALLIAGDSPSTRSRRCGVDRRHRSRSSSSSTAPCRTTSPASPSPSGSR